MFSQNLHSQDLFKKKKKVELFGYKIKFTPVISVYNYFNFGFQLLDKIYSVDGRVFNLKMM